MATQARQEEGRRQIEALERQLGKMRTQFSAELERTREQVAVAQERAEATDRRALHEIDQERTLRQKGEQAVAELRTELAAMQARAQGAAVTGAEVRARLQAECDTLCLQLAQAEQALEYDEAAQGGLRDELEVALRRNERADAEATATRRLVGAKRRAPGAGDQNQVQAGAGLRGDAGGVGWHLFTARGDKPVDKPRGGRVPAASVDLTKI